MLSDDVGGICNLCLHRLCLHDITQGAARGEGVERVAGNQGEAVGVGVEMKIAVAAVDHAGLADAVALLLAVAVFDVDFITGAQLLQEGEMAVTVAGQQAVAAAARL